jgi:Derlin-2/3
LEEGSFRGRTGDFFFLWLFCASFLVVTIPPPLLLLLATCFLPRCLDTKQAIQGIMYFIPKAPSLLFLAPSLAFAVVYVWSRRNKNVTMSFLGLFTFTAPYLPWVILGFGTS